MGNKKSYKIREDGLIFSVNLPLKIKATKKGKKEYYLNLNNYRNWKFYLSNNLKQNFKSYVKLPNIQIKKPIWIEYIFYPPDKRKRDMMNVVSVISKFFEDVLVSEQVLKDDNTSYIKGYTIKLGKRGGGYVKTNIYDYYTYKSNNF